MKVRLCCEPGCQTLGRRGWAKGYCSIHAQQNNLVCTRRSCKDNRVRKRLSLCCEPGCQTTGRRGKAKGFCSIHAPTKKKKGFCDEVKHGQADGEASGEAGGEVCEEANAAGSEEAKEAEDQEEAGDEELQCTWFKMCLDFRKRACEEKDDVEEDPLLFAREADGGSEEDEDKPWFDDIATMPEAYLGVYVLDDVHMHGVPWQRQCFTLSPPSGEEEDNIEPGAGEGHEEGQPNQEKRFPVEGDNTEPGAGEGHEEGQPNQEKRFPDCVVVLADHVIEGLRRAGPVRHRPPQKKSKRARLQGPEQEAEDWACHFSEEWDLSLGWDQNLSHGL